MFKLDEVDGLVGGAVHTATLTAIQTGQTLPAIAP